MTRLTTAAASAFTVAFLSAALIVLAAALGGCRVTDPLSIDAMPYVRDGAPPSGSATP